jgi:hypothetical protein
MIRALSKRNNMKPIVKNQGKPFVKNFAFD